MTSEKCRYRVTFHDAKTRQVLTVDCTNVENSPLGIMHVQLSGWVFPESESKIILPGFVDMRERLDSIRCLHVLNSYILEVAEMHDGEVMELSGNRLQLAVPPHEVP